MPLDNADIWTVDTANARLAAIRADTDAALEYAADYGKTPEGAETIAAAELAYRIDQGIALALSTMLLDTAPPAVVVARAYDAGLTPRAARAEQFLSPMIVPSGTVKVSATAVILDDTGAAWSIASAYTSVAAGMAPLEVDGNGDYSLLDEYLLLVVAAAAGAVSPASFAFSPAIAGITFDAIGNGTVMVSGRDAESVSELRARVAATESRVAGSAAGIRTAVLDAGATAVSIAESAGSIEVSVAVSGVALTATTDIADALYRAKAAGIATAGGTSVEVEGVDGFPVLIQLGSLTTQTVDVVAVLVTDGTVSDSATVEAAEVALRAFFNALQEGGEAAYFLALCACKVPGVTGFTVFTLDGGTADVVPATSTTLLVPSLAVSIAP